MRPRLPLLALALACLAPLLRAESIDLGATLAKWGYGKDTAASGDIGRWSRQGFPVSAEKNRAFVELGGVRCYIGTPIIAANGSMLISRHDFDKTLTPVLAPKGVSVPKLQTIILDAGHGGKDPGKQNLALGLNEKTLSIDVVKRLKFILESRGYRVLQTRARDSFIELADRAEFANRQKADLFVSIHFNAGPAHVTGIETYCLSPAGQHSTNDPKSVGDTGLEYGNRNDAWNILLAYHLQKALVDKLDAEDRGVRRARFAVLKDIACPGALVECGFLSNNAEAGKIATPVYREKIAQGVAEAIARYHAKIEKLAAPAPKPAAPKPAAKPASR